MALRSASPGETQTPEACGVRRLFETLDGFGFAVPVRWFVQRPAPRMPPGTPKRGPAGTPKGPAPQRQKPAPSREKPPTKPGSTERAPGNEPAPGRQQPKPGPKPKPASTKEPSRRKRPPLPVALEEAEGTNTKVLRADTVAELINEAVDLVYRIAYFDATVVWRTWQERESQVPMIGAFRKLMFEFNTGKYDLVQNAVPKRTVKTFKSRNGRKYPDEVPEVRTREDVFPRKGDEVR